MTTNKPVGDASAEVAVSGIAVRTNLKNLVLISSLMHFDQHKVTYDAQNNRVDTFYSLTLNNYKKNIFKMRISGIINSILGNKSKYRI